MAMLLAMGRLLGKIPNLLEYLQYLYPLAQGLRIEISSDLRLLDFQYTMYHKALRYHYK